MLSLGAVALLPTGKEVGSFEVNLELLEGAVGHPDTMAWWSTQGAAWAACRTNLKSPVVGMVSFVNWVNEVSAKNSATPVCVAYPAGFDFTFAHWYITKFVGKSPFSFACLDMKTFAMAILGTPYRGTTKRTMPKKWFKDLPPHEHVALSDAREQGQLFIRMLQHARPT